jgi:hypothetical protein
MWGFLFEIKKHPKALSKVEPDVPVPGKYAKMCACNWLVTSRVDVIDLIAASLKKANKLQGLRGIIGPEIYERHVTVLLGGRISQG